MFRPCVVVLKGGIVLFLTITLGQRSEASVIFYDTNKDIEMPSTLCTIFHSIFLSFDSCVISNERRARRAQKIPTHSNRKFGT